MPTYITLLRFTQKGMQDIKHGPDRLDNAREAIRAAGGENEIVLSDNGPL